MGLTIQYSEGDAVTDDRFAITIALPDSGTSIVVSGTVALAGQTPQPVSGTLVAPAAPASGNVFFNIQVDGSTGIASVVSSTTAPPALQSPTSRIVFSQTLSPGQTDDALAGNDATPDNAVGTA